MLTSCNKDRNIYRIDVFSRAREKEIVTQPVYQLEEWQTYRWESSDRFYALDIKQDLFGEWSVCCAWGSLFSRRGAFRTKAVASKDEAARLFQKTAKTREKRGYRMV